MLTFLAVLAREALLRESAKIVLAAPVGARVRAADFAPSFEGRYSDQYTATMLAKISRNCASSGTQSGHLKGRVRKVLGKPAAAAYAALLGSVAGFGGPALLASLWIGILDHSPAEVRGASQKGGEGWPPRLRAGGDVVEIEVKRTWPQHWRYPRLPTRDELLRHFERHVELPWRDDLAPEYRSGSCTMIKASNAVSADAFRSSRR